MSEETLSQLQSQIRYCPVCGEESTKNFVDYTAYSGEWTCLACEEQIEVYLADTEEETDDDQESTASSLPFMFIAITIIGFIYVTSIL